MMRSNFRATILVIDIRGSFGKHILRRRPSRFSQDRLKLFGRCFSHSNRIFPVMRWGIVLLIERSNHRSPTSHFRFDLGFRLQISMAGVVYHHSTHQKTYQELNHINTLHSVSRWGTSAIAAGGRSFASCNNGAKLQRKSPSHYS